MLIMTILSILELRSVILQYGNNEEMLGAQITSTVLTLIVLLMEVLTPRPPNFVRKSKILEQRAREASENSIGNGNGYDRSVSPVLNGEEDESNDERSSLLPQSKRYATEVDSEDDEDMSEDEEVMAALELLPDDVSVNDIKEKERQQDIKPPPEVGASIFSLATFTYIGCELLHARPQQLLGSLLTVSQTAFLFKHARIPATFEDVPDLRADDKSASVVLEFRAACKTYPRWLRRRGQSGMRERPPIFFQICWYLWPQLITMLAWASIKPWLTVLPPLFINLILTWTTQRQRGQDAKAHVAILYVAGLFCSQMANSLCMSQALIIGRRLCIRAKALVISEVFTKSLRRKDLAGKALVQGEKDPKDAEGTSKDTQDGEGPASAGKIQNLVSVDASRSGSMLDCGYLISKQTSS